MLTNIKIFIKYPEGTPGTIHCFLTETPESEETLFYRLEQLGIIQALIHHDDPVDHHQVGWLFHAQPSGIDL